MINNEQFIIKNLKLQDQDCHSQLMETQDSELKLKEIQAENEEVRKKLQVFRSGLQRLMNKKSSKKQQRHEPPSHDTKLSSLANQQYSTIIKHKPSSNNSNESPIIANKVNTNQQQFGFNSTLFRQINDQTVLSNNSSGVNQIHHNHMGQYVNDNNYGSYGGMNNYGGVSAQKTEEYFSTGSKKSNQNYDYQHHTYTNNMNKSDKFNNNEPQTFKKSSLLFSEIDQLMNKVNKSSKLPIKPIQKYINQQQFKLLSDSRQIDLTLSNSSVVINSDQSRKKREVQQIMKKEKKNLNDNKNSNNNNVRQQRKKQGQKQQQKERNFMKDIVKERSLSGMKQPPLPPTIISQKSSNNNRMKQQQRHKQDDFLQWGKQISSQSKNTQQKAYQQRNIQQHKSKDKEKEQMIGNKVKQTISERKKLINSDRYMMDEPIQLQFSSQQQQQQTNKQSQQLQINKQQQQQLNQLQRQRAQLLKELNQIQQQLQQLQYQL